MKWMIAALAALCVLAGITAPFSSAEEWEPTPLPNRTCSARTDMWCQQDGPGTSTRYRIMTEEGQFCTEDFYHDQAGNPTLVDIYCARYWPFYNPVVNASLRPNNPVPPPKLNP